MMGEWRLILQGMVAADYGMKRKEWESSFGLIDKKVAHKEYILGWWQS